MAENNSLYGLLAEFDGPDELVAAAKGSYAAGYRKMDAFSPMPVHDLSESLGYDKQRVPIIVLICAMIGVATGFGLQYFVAVVDYPLNVGGRPFLSWPSFIPVTFELGVLFSAFGALIGMLLLNGLPRPYHPVFNVP
ncbi:MAG: DUF3341 domain-containing protein, partial [Candidatus Latescibacteria bacterium]|nr:DUF3341 domain-containing protein [Candidatus Latescibacterota bacterium]